MNTFSLHNADFYKTGHKAMAPANVQQFYSNLTARSAKLFPFALSDNKSVFVGLQRFLIDTLKTNWNNEFFNKPWDYVASRYQRRMDNALGPGKVPLDHIKALYDLQYLPICIKALPEGSRVPIGVPYLTIYNTVPGFGWLVGYLEDQISCELWKTITCATIAYEYRKMFIEFAERTGGEKAFTWWQGHDFSMRGMTCIEDAAKNGIGHLFSFYGTDTISALDTLDDFYKGAESPILGGSVPATEHSVMCAGGETDEKETIRRIIQDVCPSGIVSVVSDTWDYWNTISKIALELKDVILNRQVDALGNAKVVFRPDSGDPADILCGTAREFGVGQTPEEKGSLEVLWDIFGGTINEKGFKVLNPRVGLIYGDSITLNRAYDILSRMELKGFASTNIVFGIGSFTYQFMTRDTLGMAMKATATWVKEHGEQGYLVPLSKDPKTGQGKRSAKGLLRVVVNDNGDFELLQNQSIGEENEGELEVVFENGVILSDVSVEKIRAKLWG